MNTTDETLGTITPAQWSALEAAARRDAACLGREAVGNFLYTAAADATGARHWLALRRDRATAAAAVRLAHAAGHYNNRTAGPDATRDEHLGIIASNYAPIDTATRLVGRCYVEEARHG